MSKQKPGKTPRAGKKPSRAQVREALLRAACGVEVPRACDVAVVGGGAAGLAAAVEAAEAGASVVVVERDLECGRKILATGNGRCNFANEALEARRFNEPQFIEGVCGAPDAWLADVLAFWRGCGLAWTSEGGRLYPMSLQAASVRDVLLARCRRAGTVLACGREAVGIERGAGGFSLTFEGPSDGARGRVKARSVVLACGGGEPLAESLGLSFHPWSPVLCPLATHPVDDGVGLAELDGRRVRCTARLLRGGAELWCEEGEVLFRPWGLSGIVMFDFSRRAQAGDVVRLDLTNGIDAEGLAPEGILDPQVAAALGGGARALARARTLDFVVEGLMEVNKAQVKRGGLLVGEFDRATLGSTELPGLHACGEALDVDADCGGFNLAWAWKSGMVAGRAAAAYALGAAAALSERNDASC